MRNKIIKTSLVLIVGGLISKILAMVIRIISNRIIGVKGIGLYTLVLPTFNLFITIATLSIPIAISKLVAEDTRNNKKMIFGIVPVILSINIVIIIFILLNARFIANSLLQNDLLFFPIIAISLTLPFITISSICKGYFMGKEKMVPNVFSSIVEQIVRMVIIILFIPSLLKYGEVYAVTGIILINIISEIASILILFLFLPKNFKLKKEYFKFDLNNLRDVASISIPTTIGRVISSIGMFLEPIILTSILLYLGYSNDYITYEYGIILGYVIPMVTTPQFLSMAISSALLPAISKYYSMGKVNKAKQKTLQASIISIIIAIPFTLIFYFYPKEVLNIIFHTDLGYNYLKISSLLFIVSYVVGPLSSLLHAMNKSKELMYANIISIVVKLTFLALLIYFNVGIISLVISSFISYIVMIIFMFIVI